MDRMPSRAWVNFILKRYVQGVRIDAQYGFAQQHDQHEEYLQGLQSAARPYALIRRGAASGPYAARCESDELTPRTEPDGGRRKGGRGGTRRWAVAPATAQCPH